MTALVLCIACQMGDHDNHDGEHHGQPEVLGGHQCPCPGGCTPDPGFARLSVTAPTPAAGTGDGTEVIEAVLAAHRLTWWAVFPWNGGHEVAPRCTCGVLWAAGDKDDLGRQTARWEAHVAAAIRAALDQGTPPDC